MKTHNSGQKIYYALQNWINSGHEGLCLEIPRAEPWGPYPEMRIVNRETGKGLDLDIAASGSFLPPGLVPRVKFLHDQAQLKGDEFVFLSAVPSSGVFSSNVAEVPMISFSNTDDAVRKLEPWLDELENGQS